MPRFLRALGRDRVCVVLGIMLVAQFAAICCLNLFMLKYRLGYDVSIYYSSALEMWRQRSLILSDWAYQTNYLFDSVVPLAALIYGIVGKPLASYGMANILATIAFVATFGWLLRKLGVSRRGLLLALNLSLMLHYYASGHNSNELGYGLSLFVCSGCYSVKTIASLLMVGLCVCWLEDERPWRLSVLAAALSFVSGAGSGMWMLALTIAPLCVFVAARAVVGKRRWGDVRKVLADGPLCRTAAFLAVLAAAAIAGKLVAQYAWGLSTGETDMALVSIGELWQSLWGIVQGFLSLTGALPERGGVAATSVSGLFYVCNWLLVGFCVAAVVRGVRRRAEWVKDDPWVLCVVVVVWNVAVLSVVASSYGDAYVVRYQILAYLLALPFAARLLDVVPTSVCGKLLTAGLCASMAFVNVVCDSEFCLDTGWFDTMRTVCTAVDQHEAPLVVVYDDDLSAARSMQVIDQDKVYMSASRGAAKPWGETTRFEDASDWDGRVLVLVDEGMQDSVPPWIQKELTPIGEQVGWYRLYEAKHNPFDLVVGFDEKRELSVDLTTSADVAVLERSEDDENVLINSGDTPTFVMWGPYVQAAPGTYSFTLRYRYKGEAGAVFDVSARSGTQQLGACDIEPGERSVTIPNLKFDGTEPFVEYRVFLPEHESIRVDAVEIRRV